MTTTAPPESDPFEEAVRQLMGDTPVPINWAVLDDEQWVVELRALDAWVSWLKTEYGLSAAIIPPLWHRHPELIWELSALHLFWVHSYDPQQEATGPIAFHREFAAARVRLQDWVTTSGTSLFRDRATRITAWPGEVDQGPVIEKPIFDRADDFALFIHERTGQPGFPSAGTR